MSRAGESSLRWHSRDGSPWDLGHALVAVGPGWWHLVREAWAEVEANGGEVTQVRQKVGFLDISARGPAGWLEDVRNRYIARSRTVCEVCGNDAVPVDEVVPRPTRTHCDRCAKRWDELGDERALWMEAARVWLPKWSSL